MLNDQQVRRLLDQLCIELGFCLQPTDVMRLAATPPDEPLAFTDEVFRAEGLDPTTADRHLYRQVRDMVTRAFGDVQDLSAGRPSRSGR